MKVVAVDSMVFIYHFEATEPHFSFIQSLFSQGKSQKIRIITSVISVLESLSSPKYLDSPRTAREIGLFFLEAGYIDIYDVTWDIAQEAARLRRENKYLRTPDSIQLATALVHQADIFITHDIKLQKLRFPNLKIVRLDRHGKAIP